MKRVLYFSLFLVLGYLPTMAADEANVFTKTAKQVWKTTLNTSKTVANEIKKVGQDGYSLCTQHKWITTAVGTTILLGVMYKYCGWFRCLLGLEEDDGLPKNYMPGCPTPDKKR